MKAITKWIRKKPFLGFTIICYAISWTLWIPLILSRNMLSEALAAVGLFGGPAVACILVARISSPPSQQTRSVPFWLSFVTGWVVAALAFALNSQRTGDTPFISLVVVSSVFGLIPAYIIASAASGQTRVRRTLSSLVQPGGWWGWYVLAVVLPVVMRVVSVWLANLLGWQLLYNPQIPDSFNKTASSIFVIFLYTLIYAGGLNEETGWTGVALPRLLARQNQLIATIILWAVWMLWHVPLHLSGFFDLNAHVLIGSFLGRFLLTRLFIRSRGGILTALLMHTSVNVTSQFVPLTYASLLVDFAVAIVVIIVGKMWQHLPDDSPAVLIEELEIS